MHPRDAKILALARSLLGDSTNFGDAIRALTEAVERVIPAGRIYVLGDGPLGPIIGSWISRIGITPGDDRIRIVQA